MIMYMTRMYFCNKEKQQYVFNPSAAKNLKKG